MAPDTKIAADTCALDARAAYLLLSTHAEL